MSETYLLSTSRFKTISEVHTNTDDKIVKKAIQLAQDIELEQILGTTLVDALKTKVSAGTIDDVGNENYLTLLNDYIENVICYYALEELVDLITFKVMNKGVLKREAEDTVMSGADERAALKRRYRTKAEIYADRLIRYLVKNETLFTEYLNHSTDIDKEQPRKQGWNPGFYFD